MIRYLAALTLLTVVAGCTAQTTYQTPLPTVDSYPNPGPLTPDLYANGAAAEKKSFVRYGRYTLASTLPKEDQRDLLAQIIDLNVPATMHPSVGDAMQYVLDRSGYALCSSDTNQVNSLYSLPLPASQYRLGPMTLRDTLQVLAGHAWQVNVDEVNRRICYDIRPGYEATAQSKG